MKNFHVTCIDYKKTCDIVLHTWIFRCPKIFKIANNIRNAIEKSKCVLPKCMEVHPYSYFRWCVYFWGPWVSFVTAGEFSVRVTKITSRIGVSWTHSLPFYFFSQFKLNELWPYYQKHVNQIILNRTTLWSLALRIFEAFIRILLIANLSLNQTLLTFLLCVRQAWMTQLILAISPWEVIFL